MNLGFQLARQIVTLIGGGQASLGGLSGLGGLGGLSASNANAAALVLTGLTRVMTSLQTAEVANTAALTANTSSLGGGAAGAGGLANLFGGGGFGGGGSGLLGGFGSLLGGFGSLLGIASLAKNLFSLFSGPSAPQQTLTPFLLPFAQSREVADTPGFPNEDRFADGTPRAYNTSGSTNPSQPLQVTVNVSTMDSRSFLDNAPVLADAVRQAMLNMNPINQLIRESF